MKRETDRDESNSLDFEMNRKIRVKTEGKTCLESSAYTVNKGKIDGDKSQATYKPKNQSDLNNLEQALIALEEMLDMVAECLPNWAD